MVVARVTLRSREVGYPKGALALAKPPDLRVEGELPKGPSVAIVGMRDATPEGQRFAFELARDLSAAGVVVWSGGALGIDSAAHRGALTSGGATVAVLGGGLDALFPPENKGLFADIARSGALVSPFRDADTPRPTRFLARNGVLAASTDATIVVECRLKSGALNAAAWCRKMKKPLGAVPHAPWAERGKGCVDLLARKLAVPIASAHHVLAIIGIAIAKAKAPAAAKSALPEAWDPLARRILKELEGATEPRLLADLCDALGVEAPAMSEALLELELRGAIQEEVPGAFTSLMPQAP
jgi:DNA processing protein